MTDDPTKVLFRISDPEHPHYPETGRLTGKAITLFGKMMAEFAIDHCKHGTDGCFVSHGQLAQIAEPGTMQHRKPARRRFAHD